MRRAGRMLLNVATGVSLLLCAATVALWVLSYCRVDEWSWNEVRGTQGLRTKYELTGNCGRAVLSWYRFETTDRAEAKEWATDGPRPFWHFVYHTFKCPSLWEQLTFSTYSFEGRNGTVRETGGGIRVPLWLPTLVCGLWPAKILIQRRRRRRGEKAQSLGLCPACGYDCCATPDRCPECGTIIGGKSEARNQSSTLRLPSDELRA